MRWIILLIFLLLPYKGFAPLKTERKLVWHDEFNGTSLNTKIWNLGWPERWGAKNSLDNVEVSNGTLKIKAKTVGKVHTTAMITTEKSFQRAFGYWEVKVRFFDLPGMWSDFWLYTRKMYPECKGVEVDVFEHRLLNWDGSLIPDIVSYGNHYNGYGEHTYVKGGKIDLNKKSTDWHIFGLLATPEKYTWYLDGKAVAEVTDIRDEPLFMILSTEILDKNWAGRTLESYDATVFEVDYVRFYE